MGADDAVPPPSGDERRGAGSLYRFQAMQLYAGGFCCAPLGLAKGKVQLDGSDQLSDNHAVQHRLLGRGLESRARRGPGDVRGGVGRRGGDRCDLGWLETIGPYRLGGTPSLRRV
jgi:hypothetical protein